MAMMHLRHRWEYEWKDYSSGVETVTPGPRDKIRHCLACGKTEIVETWVPVWNDGFFTRYRKLRKDGAAVERGT